MRMKKGFILLLVLLLAAGFTLGGCTAQQEDETFKVGFIYVGSPGDGGYTYAHDQGRIYMEEQLKDKNVETVTAENVAETSDCAVAIDNMVQQGCKVIFGTSYGFGPYLLEAAAKYPDVVFEHCSGSDLADNMGQYFGRMYQARYLSGIAAGAATTTNKIGYVAAMPIPEVIRGINAFTLGAQSVNPDVTVQVVFINSWYDPTKERQAAESLLSAGCDVLAQHVDTTEPVAAAEAAGAKAVGYNSKMLSSAPNGYLTAPLWNWGPFYTETVEAVMDGTWTSDKYWGGMDDGLVTLDDFGPSVTQETKDKIAALEEQFTAGNENIFVGPIYDQDGNLKVAEGVRMTDDEMWSMFFFVKGVEGTLE